MDNIETLLIDIKESLEREVREVKGSLGRGMREGFASINVRFDTQAARLDRQGALIQVGSRWTTRMNRWSEKVDAALEVKDLEINELRERIRRLEEGKQ